MSSEQNKALTRRAFDELNKKNPSVFMELSTPRTVWRQSGADIVGLVCIDKWEYRILRANPAMPNQLAGSKVPSGNRRLLVVD